LLASLRHRRRSAAARGARDLDLHGAPGSWRQRPL